MTREPQFLVVAPDAGALSEPRGFRWASTAAEAGAWQAAAAPLPGDAEASAQDLAREISSDAPSAREWTRNVAQLSAQLAMDSYRAYCRRAAELRNAKSRKDELVLRADIAALETERWGRFAAQWNRVYLLVEREAVQ